MHALHRLCAVALVVPMVARAQLPTIAEFARGMDRSDGFIPYYYSEPKARLYFERVISEFPDSYLAQKAKQKLEQKAV